MCAEYGVPFEPLDRERTLAEFMHDRLGDQMVVGDRVRIGGVELVVREMSKGKVTRIGLAIEPQAERLPILRLWRRLTGRRTMA
jgi:cell volume regulation protein A